MSKFLKTLEPRIEALVSAVFGVQSDSERNGVLRLDIVFRFLAQLLTDDQRVRLYSQSVTCRLRENTKILNPEKLVGGEPVWIGENSYIDASSGLKIGDHQSIGLSVYDWMHNSFMNNLCVKTCPEART
jgi:hypothetical protein